MLHFCSYQVNLGDGLSTYKNIASCITWIDLKKGQNTRQNYDRTNSLFKCWMRLAIQSSVLNTAVHIKSLALSRQSVVLPIHFVLRVHVRVDGVNVLRRTLKKVWFIILISVVIVCRWGTLWWNHAYHRGSTLVDRALRLQLSTLTLALILILALHPCSFSLRRLLSRRRR